MVKIDALFTKFLTFLHNTTQGKRKMLRFSVQVLQLRSFIIQVSMFLLQTPHRQQLLQPLMICFLSAEVTMDLNATLLSIPSARDVAKMDTWSLFTQ